MNHTVVIENEINGRDGSQIGAESALSVGQKLLSARQQQGNLDLDSISRELCIRPHLLAALEQDDFNKFPSACYAAGFLKNYAAYLNLNVPQVIAQYKNEFNGSSKKVDLKFIEVKKTPNYRHMATLSLVTLSLTILYGVWFSSGQNERLTLQTLPEMSDMASTILATAFEKDDTPQQVSREQSKTPRPNPVEIQHAAARLPAQETAESSGFTLMQQAQATPLKSMVKTPVEILDQVRLSVREDTWVRVVSADQEILVDRIILAGEEFYMTDRPGMTLMTSNAGAVALFVGDIQIAALGQSGEIRENVSLDKDDLLQKSAQLSH